MVIGGFLPADTRFAGTAYERALAEMARKFALIIVTFCTSVILGGCGTENSAFPKESSFIIEFADQAIDAEGSEAIYDRSEFRSVFAKAFLRGYADHEGTISTDPTWLWSRLFNAGWIAGQAYRIAHPGSLADIMHEYGFSEFTGTGSWTIGFEAGTFQSDTVRISSGDWPQSCWYLETIRSEELDAQLAEIIPPEEILEYRTLRVRVGGYVSELGQFGHLGKCEREVYAVSVAEEKS